MKMAHPERPKHVVDVEEGRAKIFRSQGWLPAADLKKKLDAEKARSQTKTAARAAKPEGETK